MGGSDSNTLSLADGIAFMFAFALAEADDLDSLMRVRSDWIGDVERLHGEGKLTLVEKVALIDVIRGSAQAKWLKILEA